MAASRSHLQRHLRTAALFLLLGAITTVVISWVFALLGTIKTSQFSNVGNRVQPVPWPVRVAREWPKEAHALQELSGRGLRIDHALAVDDAGRQFSLFSSRFGWPLQAMQRAWPVRFFKKKGWTRSLK